MVDISPQYLAGVADSDGSFSLMKRTGQSTTTGYFYRSIFQLSWSPSSNANKVMRYLKRTYGGTFCACVYRGLGSKDAVTLKYSVESKGLLKLIQDIKPHLILKKDRAKLIEKQILLRQSFVGYKKPKSMWLKEDKIYLAMNGLNSKNSKI